MAYLTDKQKLGLANLIQDWPIQKAGKVDYDMIRPMRVFDKPPLMPEVMSNVGAFVLNPDSRVSKPPLGPPFGLSREYGTDPFIYARDIEKFQPEWTPGATEEGKLNKTLAEEIGHEARHHELIKNPELLEDLNIPALEGKGHVAHETYNAYLDAIAKDELATKGFNISGDFYKFLTSQRKPGEGAFGIRGLYDLFENMRGKYMKHVAPKAGPRGGRPPSPGPFGGPGQPAWSSGADLSPGGGYGQSPTGSDIAGTPFSRGGILGAF